MRLCIFGAGGFAKEVWCLARQCGVDVESFIDVNAGGQCCGISIHNDNYFNPRKHTAVVAVGDSKLRSKIVNKIIEMYGHAVFTTLIAPSANLMDSSIDVGYGSVICPNSIITCDVTLGPWSQLNLATTIGHDVKTGAFFTTAPGVHISGKVTTGERVYFGTNSACIEGVTICDDVVVGAGACVTKDISEPGVYVGTPAKKMERKHG